MAMLLAVYGDSLGLPRRVADVGYADTYAELLADRLGAAGDKVALYNRSMAGFPIGKMLDHFVSDQWSFGQSKPSICVVQVGIVDCAPRPVTRRAKQRIERLPAGLRDIVVRTIRKLRPTLIEHGAFTRETSEVEFRGKLSEFLDKATETFDKVIVVNICPNHPNIDLRSPRLRESIAAYNRIISDVVAAARNPAVRLADVFAAISAVGTDGYVTPTDGHHISVAGHRVYAEVIARALASGAQCSATVEIRSRSMRGSAQ